MASDMSRDFPFDRFRFDCAHSLRRVSDNDSLYWFFIEKRVTMERAINPFYPRIRPFPPHTVPALVTYITYGGNERAFRCVTLTATGTFHELRL